MSQRKKRKVAAGAGASGGRKAGAQPSSKGATAGIKKKTQAAAKVASKPDTPSTGGKPKQPAATSRAKGRAPAPTAANAPIL